MKLSSDTKAQYWAYFLLASRFLRVWTLVRYGWSKLTDSQFSVNEKTINMLPKNIDLFRLSWHLVNHEPFKSFIGIAQLFTAALLVFNRTVWLGAFISIPTWLNILLWDMPFMEGFAAAFTCRLSFYTSS